MRKLILAIFALLAFVAWASPDERLEVFNPSPFDDQFLLPQPLAGQSITVQNLSILDAAVVRDPAGFVTHTVPASSSGRYISDGNRWWVVNQYPAPGGGGGAPANAQYWVGAPDGTLSAEKDLSALATGLVINTAGTPSAYGGTTCVNQFARSLNASGAATCATVQTTDVVSTLNGWADLGATVEPTTSTDTIRPGADVSQSLGAATRRWNDMWGNRVMGGHQDSAGTGIINAATQTAAQPGLFSDAAGDSATTMGTWLIRRSRGSLASKTNVLTGDGLASIEIQPDPAGGGGVVQGATVLWITESRTASNAIGVAERHYTRGTAAGAAMTQRWEITANGNVVTGTQAGALATTATDGFLYIPTCAGVPTGVPTAYTGTVPMVYDTTNFRLYVYAGGAWRIH